MRFLTDFNEIENEDRIWADLDDANFVFEADLQPGRTIELYDGAGHWCVGIITEIDRDRRLVRAKLDWQTWRSARYPRNRELVAAHSAGSVSNNAESVG
jgi:hypothetical protein